MRVVRRGGPETILQEIESVLSRHNAQLRVQGETLFVEVGTQLFRLIDTEGDQPVAELPRNFDHELFVLEEDYRNDVDPP